MKRLWRDRLVVLGALFVALTAVLAILAPALAPADPVKNRLLDRLTPPAWTTGGSPAHPLGTDTLGRDVASRLLHGARVSLAVAFSAVLLSGLAGVALGLVAGYYRGRLDDALMRMGDIQLAFPVLVLAIAVLAVLGASLGNVILVLGLTGWVTFARIVRGETLSLRHREFVEAARAPGARGHRGGLALLPGPRHPAARALVGRDARRGAELTHHRVVARPLSGPGHPAPRAGNQPGGRLAPRPARSPPGARDVSRPPLIVEGDVRRPPLIVVLVAVVILALGETGGAAMSWLRPAIERHAAARVEANRQAHGLSGSAEYDDEVRARAIYAAEAGLSFFHTHAEGMGLVLFFASTLVASVVPGPAVRALLYVLLTLGALFPLGYLAYGIAVLEAGRDAGIELAEGWILTPLGLSAMAGLAGLAVALVGAVRRARRPGAG